MGCLRYERTGRRRRQLERMEPTPSTKLSPQPRAPGLQRGSGKWWLGHVGKAERAGFEPAVPVVPARRFSKPVHSTSLPPLRLLWILSARPRRTSPLSSPRRDDFAKGGCSPRGGDFSHPEATAVRLRTLRLRYPRPRRRTATTPAAAFPRRAATADILPACWRFAAKVTPGPPDAARLR